jgi:hypothetical protein
MGTWSTSVSGNDTYGDVAAAFEEHLKQSQSVEQTTEYVLASMAEYFVDPDDYESAYFALADQQWTYGALDDSILAKVSVKNFGMDAWSDADATQISKRRKAVESFLKRIRKPNPRPKRMPRIVRRKPKFQPGACLSFQHADGRYTAGLVTAIHDKDPEHGRDLVVLMDYLSTKPPVRDDFVARNWLHTQKGTLMCYWYGPTGYRTISKLLTVVDVIELQESDPKDSGQHADWRGFGNFVIRVKEACEKPSHPT